MPKKNKKQKEELDTQTTFADMNLEGFRWYDPSLKKNQGKKVKHHVSRKEYWQMVKGAFAAFAPFFVIMILSLSIVFLLAYIWLS